MVGVFISWKPNTTNWGFFTPENGLLNIYQHTTDFLPPRGWSHEEGLALTLAAAAELGL